MRPDRVRLGILVALALLAVPPSALAQSPSNDAAIAELRQLLADQRAALDRQTRVIEEQGRTLAALQQRLEGMTTAPAATAVVGLRLRCHHNSRKPARLRPRRISPLRW